MTSNGFAIIPDGAAAPAAIFYTLEDALDWALDRFGGDQFTIRRFDFLPSDMPGRSFAN